jgi:hypothetical protein
MEQRVYEPELYEMASPSDGAALLSQRFAEAKRRFAWVPKPRQNPEAASSPITRRVLSWTERDSDWESGPD